MASIIGDGYEYLKRRVFLLSWISVVVYLFYSTFIFYKNGRQFYYLRKILGLGLCISRSTATVLNICCALVLLPRCKKLNQILYRILSRIWPELFFFWLEKAKSFHMTVALTLLLFAVIHSISHFVNLWNFSRNYDEERKDINFAYYKDQSPLLLLLSLAGLTGISMLLIILSMGLTSMRIVRRRLYNAFWYTHQFYLPFIALLIIHPLSGVLKEEVLVYSANTSLNSSHVEHWANYTTYAPKFVAIKSKTWLWMVLPLSCFFVDLLWRIFSRNRSIVDIIEVRHMAGRTLSMTISCSHEQFACRPGQYVLLQCCDVSLLEWHPFTVVQVPTSDQRKLVVWIRIKGDWTERLEEMIIENGPDKLRVFIDGPFSSPMEGVSRSEIAICVAAGVGITPFVAMLHHMLQNPRRRLPGRIHLLWIIRYEQEITWLADLANKTLMQLRNANRPDRLNLELYVTNSKRNNIITKQYKANTITHVVVFNENGNFTHILARNDKTISDDEKLTLLTPTRKRNAYIEDGRKNTKDNMDNKYNIAKEYPLLGCRVRKGRPYWDRIFGYWVHLYPEEHLSLYCCGPKKLVKLLRSKCKYTSRTTKTKFTFVHEGFS